MPDQRTNWKLTSAGVRFTLLRRGNRNKMRAAINAFVCAADLPR
jgi:hypothetical protein